MNMQNILYLFRVFKTDIPGSDSSFRLSTFSTDFSTINTDFPQSRLKGQVFHILDFSFHEVLRKARSSKIASESEVSGFSTDST
jgi:hypothetical protein